MVSCVSIIQRMFFLCFLFLFSFSTLFAQVKFSSRESRIAVNGGSLFIQNPYEQWTGTLEQKNGTLQGSSIGFDYGKYRKNNKDAEIKGKMNGAGVDFVLQGNDSIFAHPGMAVAPILVLGSGNILEGQPDFTGTTTLLNSFSELQLNITNRLGQSILMNDGLITLLNDLTLGDNTVFTGSGRINLNYKTLKLPAKETLWTSQLYFSTPNDIVLSSKTALSGTWTFDGANAVLNGNGNILDLTLGGSLWIKSGTEVECTDIHIRGLGDLYGSIIFEDATSRIRLSNATLQLASNYSVTQGGIYIEGGHSLIITGTNILSIATGASMTVDRVTCFADALDATATVNISPNLPDNQKLIYLNNGILKAQGEGNVDNSLAIANSNAIVGWIKDTSNAMVSTYNLVVQNSWAIESLDERVVANSYGIVNLDNRVTANSSAIVAINNLAVATSYGLVFANSLATFNSHAIISQSQGITDNSWAILNLNNRVTANSNAIMSLSQGVTDNSNALVGWAKDTSNAVIASRQLAVSNSNAIVGWIKNTSNVMVSTYNLLRQTSNALLALSQELVFNSNAIAGWVQETSNVMVSTYNLVVQNSNAIVSWALDTSNVVANLVVAMSNALIGLSQEVTFHSNAIAGWVQETSNMIVSVYALAVQNSNAIVQTSNNLVFANSLAVFNSHAIVSLSQGVTNNSNALVGWVKDTSNIITGLYNFEKQNSSAILNLGNRVTANSSAIVGWIKNTSNVMVSTYNLVIDNSNAIIGWVKDTSNAVAGLMIAMSDAIVAGGGNALAIDNSNAIVSWGLGTSNAVAGLMVDMSNSIVAGGGNALAVDNSNAIIGWIQDTSNNAVSTYNLVVQNSYAAVFAHSLSLFNSNAIKALSAGVTNNSQAILSLSQEVTNNSNAIVGWIKDTSSVMVSTYNLVVENSWAIVGLGQGVAQNSWAVLALNDQVAANSWAILNLDGQLEAHSNAIVTLDQKVADHNAAILGWIQDTSNAAAGLLVDTSYAVVAVLDRIISPTTRYLLENKPTASVIMDDSLYLDPGDRISIYGDLTIDGSGATIFFCDPFRSQLAVLPGNNVRIRNVTLANLNANSIHIPINSQLIIEDNVTFYLSNDMTFSLGSIVLGAEASNFFVHGYGGTRKLTFSKHPALLTPGLQLGSSSLVLQNIELDGVDAIDKTATFIDGQLIEGGIVCAGNTTINFYNSSSMNFLIEYLNNAFCIRENSIALRGSISYGDKLLNELFIQFSLQTLSSDPYRMIFGDNSFYLASSIGRAHILFTDFLVQVFNEGSNSFLMDARSGLFGRNLFIQNFPIKLLSTQFEIDDSLILSSDQDNAIDISFVRSIERYKKVMMRPLLAYEFRRAQAFVFEKNNTEG